MAGGSDRVGDMRELQPIVNRWFGRVPSAPRRKDVAKGTARPAGRTHPGVAAVPSASTRKEAVVPASACEAGQRQAVPWPTNLSGAILESSRSVGFSGRRRLSAWLPMGPGGSAPPIQNPNSAWSAHHRKRVSSTIHHVGVTACGQYIIRTVIISNIVTELHHLRPDRDSNAGPTA